MHHRKYPFVAGFLALPLGLYLVLVVWPALQTFGYSLTDWNGESSTVHLVGLRNYRELLGDGVFRTALVHNLFLLVALPLLTIGLALFFAFLLDVVRVPGARLYRVVFFFPQLLSVGILAVLFDAVYRPDGSGLVNGVLTALGLQSPDQPQLWFSAPGTVLWCVLSVLVWSGVGFYLVLFSAAMRAVPREVYEAAVLDGAGRARTFWRITLPLLRDTVRTAWVYLAITAMDAFALVATLTPGTGFGGGPDHHGEVLATYFMRNFQTFGRSGYACAMGVVIFLFTLLISVVALSAGGRDRIEY
jgi:N-acetylglucosamine transport system permease protein